MANKSSKIFVIVAAILVVVGFFYTQDKNTLFDEIVEPLQPVAWDEVKTKHITEYSIPISTLEKNGNDCLTTAKNLNSVLNHTKFTSGPELANKLQFDLDSETIIIPCAQMKGEPSEFTVWYVSPESKVHNDKYEYYIDPYDGTLGRGVNYWNQTGSISLSDS